MGDSLGGQMEAGDEAATAAQRCGGDAKNTRCRSPRNGDGACHELRTGRWVTLANKRPHTSTQLGAALKQPVGAKHHMETLPSALGIAAGGGPLYSPVWHRESSIHHHRAFQQPKAKYPPVKLRPAARSRRHRERQSVGLDSGLGRPHVVVMWGKRGTAPSSTFHVSQHGSLEPQLYLRYQLTL